VPRSHEAGYDRVTALAAAVVQQAPETNLLLNRLLEETLAFAGAHYHRGISFGVRAEALRQTLRSDPPRTGEHPSPAARPVRSGTTARARALAVVVLGGVLEWRPDGAAEREGKTPGAHTP
jgi:hypothetical protein